VTRAEIFFKGDGTALQDGETRHGHRSLLARAKIGKMDHGMIYHQKKYHL